MNGAGVVVAKLSVVPATSTALRIFNATVSRRSGWRLQLGGGPPGAPGGFWLSILIVSIVSFRSFASRYRVHSRVPIPTPRKEATAHLHPEITTRDWTPRTSPMATPAPMPFRYDCLAPGICAASGETMSRR